MKSIHLAHQGCAPEHSMANGGGSGGGSSTTVQEIPWELKPLATKYNDSAINLANTPYQPYYGQRVADLSGYQNAAAGMIANRAQNGSQTINNAESNLNQVMSGGNNPYLDASVNKALGQVKSQVNSQFSGSNYGTSANQEQLTNNLGNVATQMYGQAYDADQNRRLQAISQAPTFGNQAYQDASQLMGAGQMYQDQQQQGLDTQYQSYLDAQNDPYRKLAAMSGVFGSNLGGTSTTTQNSGGK